MDDYVKQELHYGSLDPLRGRRVDFKGTVCDVQQHEPGAKLDSGKPDASLLQFFSRALLEVARVGTYGAEKYTRGGWLEVPNGRDRYVAAMVRHHLAENHEGPFDLDPMLKEYGYEGKIRHKAQVAWNALAALELELIGEEDDGE